MPVGFNEDPVFNFGFEAKQSRHDIRALDVDHKPDLSLCVEFAFGKYKGSRTSKMLSRTLLTCLNQYPTSPLTLPSSSRRSNAIWVLVLTCALLPIEM